MDFNERPAIGVAKSVAFVKNNGGAPVTYDVTYDLVVQNLGDVALSNVQVVDDLRITFPLPVTLSGASVQILSGPLTANAGYTGQPPNTNLLAGPDTLAVGASATIRVKVTVGNVNTATPYNNQAVAAGASPAGTVVNDRSDNGIEPDPNGNGNANEPDENDPTPVLLSESPVIGVAKKVVSNTPTATAAIPWSTRSS